MNREVNAPGKRARVIATALALMIGLAVLPWSARADLRVTASIPPLHSLVAQVMTGAGAPELLIPGGASPHGFSLAPSQAEMLSRSDVLFWVGQGLEAALSKPIATLARNATVVAMADVKDLVRLKRRSADLGDGHGHDHGHGHGRNQAAGGDDPHYWLDPANAKAMIDMIARTLGAAAPGQKALFLANADDAKSRIDAMMREFTQRLDPLKNRPFIVFHDAYQYLETRFGLHAAGILAVDPERPAGARHVNELRELLRQRDIICLFTEPQLSSRLADRLVKGTATRIATLDPLGSGMAPGAGLYERMMTANLTALESCLTARP